MANGRDRGQDEAMSLASLTVPHTPPKTFDVICAGEARWNLVSTERTPDPLAPLRFRPGGAIDAALALGRRGLRVGLATAISDDTMGRKLLEKVAFSGVDIGGVALASPHTGLVFLEGTEGVKDVVPYREDERPVAVPSTWKSEVLLLSGVSPVLSHGAALCKAARAARKSATTIVLDVNASLRLWAGRDPRAIRAILREVDVVRCTREDLATLRIDVAEVRASMRPNAVLVMDNGSDGAWAAGPFGEVARARRRAADSREGVESLPASICAELSRKHRDDPEMWERALWGAHVR